MGFWGIGGLQSDEGLDFISFLELLFKDKKEITLAKIISECIKQGLIKKNIKNADCDDDLTIMCIAELLLIYKKKGNLGYDNFEEDNLSLNKKQVIINKTSIEFIKKYFKNSGIQSRVDSMEWEKHVDDLILKIENYEN